MRECLPKRLAAFGFFTCAIATGAGYALSGGTLSSEKAWIIAMCAVLAISALVGVTVWVVSRAILKGKGFDSSKGSK